MIILAEAAISHGKIIAGNNGGNYIWQFAPCSTFDFNLVNLFVFFTLVHNTKVVANGLNFNFGRNLI